MTYQVQWAINYDDGYRHWITVQPFPSLSLAAIKLSEVQCAGFYGLDYRIKLITSCAN